MENNHILGPGSYSIEWYKVELRSKCPELPEDWASPTYERAKEISRTYDVPLHPRFNLFWYDVPVEELIVLRDHIIRTGTFFNGELIIAREHDTKHTLETLGALHRATSDKISLSFYALPLLDGLGLDTDGTKLVKIKELVDPGPMPEVKEDSPTLRAVSKCMGFEVRARSIIRIGARMARPEKAKERKMKPPPHALFPLGQSGGMQRLVSTAQGEIRVEAEMGVRQCPMCGKNTVHVLL